MRLTTARRRYILSRDECRRLLWWGSALPATGTRLPNQGSAMDLSDFTLDTLNKEGEFVLFRGRDRRGTTGHPPSVLVVMPRSEHPRTDSVRMMEHEHSLRAELDPAWAVRPLELTHHEERNVLVLEDPGGEPLAPLLPLPMQLRHFLRVPIRPSP